MNIKYITLVAVLVCSTMQIQAGNPDRAGAAGATHLLINPWARSSGWGTNTGGVKGIESSFFNIAGMANTKSTELIFNRCNLFQGTGMSINTLGFSQHVGNKDEGGVMGLVINSFGSGDIPITTVDQPGGGLGSYNFNSLDFGLAYSKNFSDAISGGMMAKMVSSGISNVRASGLAIDAGVQYGTSSISSAKDSTGRLGKIKKLKGNDTKFGISIKNVGPDLSYGGDGLSFRGIPDNGTYPQTVEQRSSGVNLPSQVNIGGSYDFRLDKGSETYYQRLTLGLNYTSNSFTNDQIGIGVEYGYKDFFMLRGGYTYEKDINDPVLTRTAFTGLNGGFTIEMPIGKNKSSLALDYSYRFTNVWGGCHTFGARINLGSSD
ncbi:MAG: PorV/PorQ family protein [Flavobacteriaceae bacterium]|nr:PorV/PorQ family protein [Flavobacteriaceae bacterium]